MSIKYIKDITYTPVGDGGGANIVSNIYCNNAGQNTAWDGDIVIDGQRYSKNGRHIINSTEGPEPFTAVADGLSGNVEVETGQDYTTYNAYLSNMSGYFGNFNVLGSSSYQNPPSTYCDVVLTNTSLESDFIPTLISVYNSNNTARFSFNVATSSNVTYTGNCRVRLQSTAPAWGTISAYSNLTNQVNIPINLTINVTTPPPTTEPIEQIVFIMGSQVVGTDTFMGKVFESANGTIEPSYDNGDPIDVGQWVVDAEGTISDNLYTSLTNININKGTLIIIDIPGDQGANNSSITQWAEMVKSSGHNVVFVVCNPSVINNETYYILQNKFPGKVGGFSYSPYSNAIFTQIFNDNISGSMFENNGSSVGIEVVGHVLASSGTLQVELGQHNMSSVGNNSAGGNTYYSENQAMAGGGSGYSDTAFVCDTFDLSTFGSITSGSFTLDGNIVMFPYLGDEEGYYKNQLDGVGIEHWMFYHPSTENASIFKNFVDDIPTSGGTEDIFFEAASASGAEDLTGSGDYGVACSSYGPGLVF